MRRLVVLLESVVATLPAVGVLIVLDSISLEPYKPPLYLGIAVAGLALGWLYWMLVGPPDREKPSVATRATAADYSFVATGLVAVGVVIWLFRNGH